MKLKAILASVGLAVTSLFAVGGVQLLSQTAAHADATEAWTDITSQIKGYTPYEVDEDAHGQMDLSSTEYISMVVRYTGTGWCVADPHGNWFAPLPIETANYGCGANEQVTLTCVGSSHPHWFTVKNQESGYAYWWYNGSYIYGNGIGGDTFADATGTEC